VLHPDEQTILFDFYNSLQSKGILNWNITNDLCVQPGSEVICDSSDPQRVTELYCFWVSLHLIKFNAFFILDISVFANWAEQFQHNLGT